MHMKSLRGTIEKIARVKILVLRSECVSEFENFLNPDPNKIRSNSQHCFLPLELAHMEIES
jgi:hypothetical protein